MAFQFSPPGGLTDMNEAALETWHRTIDGFYRSVVPVPNTASDLASAQFFNPANGIEADATELPIAWTAFPRPETIDSATDEERWARADRDRRTQVEYCEWSVTRDAAGKVVRVDFTCEDPFYFDVLFSHQPETVLALYRQHVSPRVEMSDLRNEAGQYLYINKWNSDSTNGAMHMIGGPNNISAAIVLAAGASIVRANPDGSLKTGARELILCGAYGAVERHSDPHIGSEVNTLVRAGHFVALANPTQLAFESISFENWEVPGGPDPASCWTFTRGVEGRAVRGVLQAPPGAAFSVGDIRIDGLPIRFGGQVADKIRIKVVGLAHRLGQAKVEPVQGCAGDAKAGLLASNFSLNLGTAAIPRTTASLLSDPPRRL